MRPRHFFMAATGVLLISTIALCFVGALMPVADVDLLKGSQTTLVCFTIASAIVLLISNDD